MNGTEFIETLLKHRCPANGGLFSSVVEAKRWLLGEAEAQE